jgi:CRISPR-associated Csx2 family protein
MEVKPMARVFLSFLGTTNYQPCIYKYQSSEVDDIRFVQEATIKTFCTDWKPEDRYLIFLTPEAKEKNWQDNGHRDKAGDSIQLEGLQSRLIKFLPENQIFPIDIPEGKSQEEIWEIFQKIIDQLQENDEVVFDVTHGFRSIPLLAIVVLSYARVMKDIAIRGIYYGAFEAAKNGAAPIFDLTEFDLLLEWTTALDRFLKAGDSSLACELAENEVHKKKMAIKKADPVLQAFYNVTRQLGDFSLSLTTCRGLKITQTTADLKQALQKCEGLSGMRPYIPLLQKVQREMENFPGDQVRDGFAAAQWCTDHSLVQQGYTILQETLITFFTKDFLNADIKSNSKRELVNQAINIFVDNKPLGTWKPEAQNNKTDIKKITDFLGSYPDMAKKLRNLNNIRNDINHAGFREGYMGADRFAPKLKEYIEYFGNIVGIGKR